MGTEGRRGRIIRCIYKDYYKDYYKDDHKDYYKDDYRAMREVLQINQREPYVHNYIYKEGDLYISYIFTYYKEGIIKKAIRG